jgi:hypothetical protein
MCLRCSNVLIVLQGPIAVTERSPKALLGITLVLTFFRQAILDQTLLSCLRVLERVRYAPAACGYKRLFAVVIKCLSRLLSNS